MGDGLGGMLDAGMRINDNIDRNWANEICKCGITITTCSLENQKN